MTKKPMLLFLVVCVLVVAVSGCGQPVPSATGAATGVPTEPPTEMPTTFPTETLPPKLTEAPTEAAAQAPTEAATPAPTEVQVQTPTEVPPQSEVPPGSVCDDGGCNADTLERQADGAVMVYVPAGEFAMGSSEGAPDEQPVHPVTVDAFWIDRTEVSNELFRACAREGKCREPILDAVDTQTCRWWKHVKPFYDHKDDMIYGKAAPADRPAVCVEWGAAADYCAWAGGRLPTEAEWEYAARGPDAWEFPWGNEFDGHRLNSCDANCIFPYADKSFNDGFDDTAPVGSYAGGASWSGALDMAGNVYEWVADWYAEDYYSVSPSQNPLGPASGQHRVARGGMWLVSLSDVRSSHRYHHSPGIQLYGFGFRCAMDAVSAP